MQTLKIYLYPNTLVIQFLDPSVTSVRNPIVYNRKIKLYQGIDNPVQIHAKNQDQKTINLTGYTVHAQIQDPVNHLTVHTYPVIWSDITKGLGSIVFDKTTLDDLEQRIYQLTFKAINNSTNAEKPFYIDDNYGALVDVEVHPAYYSTIVPTAEANEQVIDGGYIL